MTAQHLPFALFAGDSWTFDASLHDAEGAPLDLSGAVIVWRLRNAAQAVVATLSIGNGITIVNEAGGLCSIELAAAKTAALPPGINYADEIRVTLPDGEVTTQAVGVITVAVAGVAAPDLAGELAALKKQRRSGVSETQLENFRVRYRSDAEIAAAIAATQNELAGGSQVRNVYPRSKGWSR